MIGRTIGHYKVVDKIGEGGMGAVYRAEDTSLHRLVALKTLSSRLDDSEEARERFIREAESASSLNHPNITTIYELLEEEGQHYISMEYVEGKTIRDVVESGQLSVRKALDILIQTAEALEAAHARGILHRDIKSSNIMLSMEGRVKVMDFGLAHLEERSRLTRSGTTMGTLAYASPEQLTGRDIDRRSEIWSLGVVFYELLTGQQPFRGPSEGELVFAIINSEPDAPGDLREEIPETLLGVLRRMLEKDPALRYASCSELLDDLRQIRKGFETTTQILPSEAPFPHSRWKRNLVFGGAAVVLAVMGLFLPGILEPAEQQLPRIAVLPFENLGAADDDYFADGLTDEIISRLTMLRRLRPIARASVMPYRGTDKTLRQIGQELDVSYILTGTVRWEHREEGSIVRITPRLSLASDETEIWSAPITDDFAGIFRIQSQVAEQVAGALEVSLADSEQQALTRVPTRDMEAYRAYLQGSEHIEDATTEEKNRLGLRSLQLAVERDPGFAEAWGEIAKAHAQCYHWGFDRTPERRQMAREAAAEARRLGPSIPAVHRSLGYYHYWAFKDYEQALQEFAIAEKGLPNDVEIINGMAAIRRRQGHFEEAIRLFREAFALDPRQPSHALETANTLFHLRRYDEAVGYYRKAIELDPDHVYSHAYLINTYATAGRLDDAILHLDRIRHIDHQLYDFVEFWCYFLAGQDSLVGEVLASTPYAAFQVEQFYYPVDLIRAYHYQTLGREDLAREHYGRAREHLEDLAARQPDDPRVHMALALSMAGLGHREEARSLADHVTETMYPVSQDALLGWFLQVDRVHVLILLGSYSEAMDRIEHLLSVPSPLSRHLLRNDPRYDPLRDRPRFQALLAGR